MGSLNFAALNLANALGAVRGSITLAAGLGALSTAWAGVLLTAAALVLFCGYRIEESATKDVYNNKSRRPGAL
jgi:predicted MFS family arabinose efflux permease